MRSACCTAWVHVSALPPEVPNPNNGILTPLFSVTYIWSLSSYFVHSIAPLNSQTSTSAKPTTQQKNSHQCAIRREPCNNYCAQLCNLVTLWCFSLKRPYLFSGTDFNDSFLTQRNVTNHILKVSDWFPVPWSETSTMNIAAKLTCLSKQSPP